jgi:hypothetical protein
MKRYLIERDIPGVGALGRAELQALAATSNAAVAQLSGKVQWVESRIARDGTFCIYLADGEEALREHSRLAGFPITRINEIFSVIDPTTAFERPETPPARSPATTTTPSPA